MGLDDKITDAASGPSKASGDAGSVEQHNLKDLIEADKYLAHKSAGQTAGLGIKRVQLVPPGAV